MTVLFFFLLNSHCTDGSNTKKKISCLVLVMGCGQSKVEDLPLVTFCKERKDLIKTASDHRFALAAAHIAYFRQLKAVGDSLCRFVDEELLVLSSSASPSSPSSLSSPVLTLPSDEGKPVKNKVHLSKKKNNNKKNKFKKGSSSSTSISHNLKDVDGDGGHLSFSSSEGHSSSSHHHHHHDVHDDDDGHLEIDEEDDYESHSHPHPHPHPHPHHHHHEKVKKAPSPQPGISYIPDDPSATSNYYPSHPYYYPNNANPSYENTNFSSFPSYPQPPPPIYSYNNGGFNNYGSTYNYPPENNMYGSSSTSYTAYYMKKSTTRIPSVIYEEPQQNPIYSFSDYPNYPPPSNGSSSSYPNYPPFGFMPNSGSHGDRQQPQQQQRRPPTPPSPKVSAWDYFNPFETLENGYYPQARFGVGYGSNTSSPDSREVREREGIPELEEETESEVIKESYNELKRNNKVPKPKKSVQFEDGDIHINNKKNNKRNDNFGEGTSRAVPPPQPEEQFRKPEPEPVPEDEVVREVKGSSPETSSCLSMTSTSPEEIPVKKKGVSFDMGGGGGEGSHLDIESSKPSSLTTTLSAHGTRDLREVVREIKDEFEAATDYGKEVSVLLEVGKEPYKSRNTFVKVMLARVCSTALSSSHTPSSLAAGDQNDFSSRSLASTLEKLYVWEKKLYKEVKDEERLRVMYEKQLKRLRKLDDRGAEIGKVEATEATIKRLLTRINVSVKAVDSISNRIHKLRDEELQPQLKELIYGLRKMWKLMLKCHQKQFQAILESKTRALKANTGFRRDSSVRATIQLEAELLKWCHRFNNWVEMQRSYAETLNNWLKKWLNYEPEVTVDGEVPFSPGRIGAPPVFVICNDLEQAMERISASEVQTAMNDFATSLHQLWERQDEEQRRRLKAENVYKDFEKQIRTIRMERQKRGHEHDDTLSEKNSLSMVTSESGISPLDDLKVDLDSMRQRVKEERAGHKEAMKLVHDAVSRSIQAGLIPIFEALESFTTEAAKAFDDVRLEHVTNGS